MAYWIKQFGSTSLPSAIPVQDVGMPRTHGESVSLPGGRAYDSLGTEAVRPALPYTLQVQGKAIGATAAALKTTWYELRALHGTRAKLYRTPEGGDENSEWVWARLIETDARRDVHWQSLNYTMTFEVWSEVWYGASASASAILAASSETITAANSGNVRVTDPVITITANASPITVLTIGVSDVSEFQWEGTLAAGSSLIIDCGAQSVTIGASSLYSGFELTANHTVDDWLRLEPGNNSVIVTRTGGSGSSTAIITYADGWA